ELETHLTRDAAKRVLAAGGVAKRLARYHLAPMLNPIVIAYHLIWTIYGYWLPNDLRGSTSKVSRNDVLKELGELHFGRKKIQPLSRDLRGFDERAAALLQFPVIELGAE